MRETRCNHHIELHVLEPVSSSGCCKGLPRSHRFDKPSSYRNLALVGVLNLGCNINGTRLVRPCKRLTGNWGIGGTLDAELD